MIRRILRVLICALCIAVSGATVSNGGGTSTIVNVKYIHSLIEQEWGIKLPYNTELTNPSAAANMRYLLAAIDATNSRIGTQTSYRTGEYATGMAANVNTSVKAVRTLIKPTYHFTATTTSDTTEFNFTISASGAFYINWGDGTAMQKIIKPATGAQTISHTYATAGAYDIRIGGRAMGYNRNAAVSFKSNLNLAGINGSLGQIFRNVGTNMPLFWETFRYCTNLRGSIPAELFDGVTGTPRTHMFDGTFDGCRGLTGSIPENLFAGIKGAPAYFTFSYTFYGCTGLTGEIPGKLFSGISGAPSVGTFEHTFYNCSGLTGPIPSGLFSGIRGAPAANMFGSTFALCRGLTGEIPLGFFGNLSGTPAGSMFYSTFMSCSGLTGPSARNPNGTPLYDVFPDATMANVQYMYRGATGLSDYADIPAAWK